jgi:hypothetical protein
MVGILLAWWGWEEGAYFDVKFIPGLLILLAVVVALAVSAPWPAALRRRAAYPALALVGLAVWTALSATWSPVPHIAVQDAQRVIAYAVACWLGLWLCLLLGPRMLLALLPLAGAGAAVGVATLLTLLTGTDTTAYLEPDGTLQFPLGYRNAAAAFFLIAVPSCLVLAASPGLDWRLRGALFAAATLTLELAILAQSRTSVFAAAIAAVVLIAAHPTRLRVAVWLGAASLPALLALPLLLEVFQHGGGDTAASISPLRNAGWAMLLSTGGSFLIGAALARREPELAMSEQASGLVTRAVVGIGVIAVAVLSVLLITAEGGPTGFLDRQLDQLSAGSPDLSQEQSRFGLDFRTERGDLWRVAADDFASNPVAGTGAGGFRLSYLRDRDSTIQPEDPHSVEMLMASELGLPGLLLFAVFAVTAFGAVWRSRRLGPSAAALSAAALSIGAYWLLHASVEWFWTYPAITLPAMFAFGAAAAPAVINPGGNLPRRSRAGLVLASAAVALVSLPLLFSARYSEGALNSWRLDLADAYADLERAADLNPLSDRPLAYEAVIAEEAGEPQRALGALSRAQQRVPEEWTLYYLEARVLAAIDPAGAQRALERARDLNPHGEEIAELEAELAGE